MSIAPEDMEACLRVLQRVSEDPDLIGDHDRMKGLIAKIHREGKKGARGAARAQGRAADRQLKASAAVVRAQQGDGNLPALTESAALGTLHSAVRCYVCKAAYKDIHPFYHLLCPECADLNARKRLQTVDLTGRTALITGGRIKIGYQTALRLLRDGARVIVTTRFPADAACRFGAEADAGLWRDRLRIEGLDLRRLPAVEEFALGLLDTEPALDILINNAAQTIRRPAAFYRHLLAAEQGRPLLEAGPAVPGDLPDVAGFFPIGHCDADGQQLDARPLNSWRLRLEDVDAVEMLEVQLINAVAPFLLNARLKPLLLRSPFARRFIINVSAMEGQFARESKTIFHPHTNMAKAALNMMTRTSAAGYARDGIYMNSVDTGWVTDENPLPRRTHIQETRGFWTPLDAVDGMARIYDPIVRGLSEDAPLFGHFLKDYAPTPGRKSAIMPDAPHCPLYTVADVVPRDPAELLPLATYLQSGARPDAPKTFPRGTLSPDGRLDLCKQSLGPGGCRTIVEALAGDTQVVSLMLGTDGIGDSGAADVAGLVGRNAALETLYLGCNKIGPAGIAALARPLSAGASLRGLWLKRNPLGPVGAKVLADMLRRNRTLRTLDLVNTQIGPDGAAALLDALTAGNRTVERLYLGGNALGPDDAPRLAALLRANPTIKALLLNVGHLGDDGAAQIAQALLENTTLEELGLASNGLSARSGEVFAGVIAGHPALRTLDLGHSPSTRVLGATPNALCDAGAAALAPALSQNPPLRSLDLRGNGVTRQGQEVLADALIGNTHLCRLLLDGKPHPRIAAIVKRNQGLRAGGEPPVARDVALTRSVYR